MPPKKKENRAYKKSSPFKDARRFIIICEGERESEYFDSFNGRTKKVIINTLDPTGDYAGKSAPNHLHDRAKELFENNPLDKLYDDGLFFVLDVDRWNRQSIDELIELVHGNENWGICISNPCFEVWLLYHVATERLTKVVSTDMKSKLDQSVTGGYNVYDFIKLITKANDNARTSDPTPESTYPDIGVTKVYKLGEEIVNSIGLKNGSVSLENLHY